MSGAKERFRRRLLDLPLTPALPLGERSAAFDVLLPLVVAYGRECAAQVLRAAAQEQRNEADNVPDTDEGTHADGHRCAADFLDRRAAALKGSEEGT